MPDIPFFDLGAQVANRRERLHAAFDNVIDEGQFVGGRTVLRFENAFASFLGAAECVSVGNGLDALRIGMEALGIGSGDEVIVPAFTFYATWLSVLQTGAVPVPVDVDATTASLNIEAIEAAFTEKTRAILVVHLYGIPANLSALRALADAAGVLLIEDAAQSHGAKSGHVMTGTAGDFSAFSFYPTKNLGALGDGGAIVTGSPEVAARARSRRSYGQGSSKYQHMDTGWNSRLDTLQAAFLLDGLAQLDEQNRLRRKTAAVYLEALGSAAQSVIGSKLHSESVWHHFVLRTTDREIASKHFAAKGVQTDVHYPYYFNTVEPLIPFRRSARLAISEALSREVLSLPIAPWMRENEISQVADALRSLPTSLIV